MEKFGPFYFVDSEVKVRHIDIDAEIEKRGGIQNIMKHNAFFQRMAKPKPKPGKPKPGC